ncbi:hypothetical protein C2G38_2116615, partial [Gigaspora rosea]
MLSQISGILIPNNTKINKYLNNYYGRKYLQIFDCQDRYKVSGKLNCNLTLEEINIPTEY